MPPEKRCCRRSRRRVYARVGRIPIGGEDSRASALPKNRDYLFSAIHLTDVDRLRGYEMGAVDYVPVPVVSELLRAKVKVFAELFRKTRQLEQLNRDLERRVADRTAELKSSATRLLQSEQLRSLALAAGQMGSWDWDAASGDLSWDEGQYRIFGVDPNSFTVTLDNVCALIHPEDWKRLRAALANVNEHAQTFQTEFRVHRPNGELRWCIGAAAASIDATHRVVRLTAEYRFGSRPTSRRGQHHF